MTLDTAGALCRKEVIKVSNLQIMCIRTLACRELYCTIGNCTADTEEFGEEVPI